MLHRLERWAPAEDADGLAGLTAREREIATLASSGITSRDIAQSLHLSVRTVDTHLGRIYRKLKVSGRVALAGKVLVDRGSGPPRDRAGSRPGLKGE